MGSTGPISSTEVPRPVSPRPRRTSLRPVPAVPEFSSPRARFLKADRYRAEREWNRYEGTAQRDLFRILRERFLARHCRPAPWVLDVGSGPGRFTRSLGDRNSRAVALDLSQESLRLLATKWPKGPVAPPLPDRVRGDAVRIPFAPGVFGTVAALGNTLGFAGAESKQLLDAVASRVGAGGVLLLEAAPGPGEESRYLARLPAGSVARLFRSPTSLVRRRIDREGFRTERPRKTGPGDFRRLSVPEISEHLARTGWEVRETVAVAPALGPDSERLDAVRSDPKAWDHLLVVEEEFGRQPARWEQAAAVLLAAVSSAPGHTIK